MNSNSGITPMHSGIDLSRFYSVQVPSGFHEIVFDRPCLFDHSGRVSRKITSNAPVTVFHSACICVRVVA